jgi:hypothetical protein
MNCRQQAPLRKEISMADQERLYEAVLEDKKQRVGESISMPADK